ncbi:hypothetical protein [Paenibacillus sp. y28]|uniref:hypothetical protein n=1 Tax=Paenibacillus sp. y28 TaxID=3129110 RepID=UPI00301A3922
MTDWQPIRLPITTGNTVWIGGHGVNLPGVTSGDPSIAAASSAVPDVPENTMIAGTAKY